jgi:putative phosphoesterase
MKLGVFSDSHGNLDYLETAASNAVHRGGAEVLIHLGDDFADATVLNQFGRRVIRVPGVFSAHYQDRAVPNRVIEAFGPWSVLITHTREKHPNDLETDLDPGEVVRGRAAHVVLYGHTHEPAITSSGGVWFINPGHLRRHDKKEHPASFALVNLRDHGGTAQIIDVSTHVQLLHGDLTLGQ